MKSNFSKRKSSSKDIALIKDKKSSDLAHFSPVGERFIESLRSKSVNHSEMIQALLDKGHISERELANIFGKEFGFEVINNLNDYKISPEVLSLVPQKVCEKNILLPLVQIDKTLVVVFSDPSDLNLRDNLFLITGLKIQPVVSTRTSIKEAFNKYFDNQEAIDNIVYDMSFEVAGFEEELAIDLDKEKDKKYKRPCNLLCEFDVWRCHSPEIFRHSY